MSYQNSLSDPERNTMVLMEAQTTTFYEGADKMAIPNTTVLELSNKGLQTVNEPSDFDKMSIKSISHNLLRPSQGNPLVLGSKFQKPLIIACDLIQYYDTVGQVPSALNMQWIPVMNKLDIQWINLKAKMDKDVPDTPKTTHGINIMKCSESFIDDCYCCIGV